MERVTGELRRIEAMKAATLINEDEYAFLRKRVLEAPLAAPPDVVKKSPTNTDNCEPSRHSTESQDTSASGLSDEDTIREESVLTNEKVLHDLSESLTTMHYRSLQSLCNYGGDGVFDNQAFGITPQDWMSCYEDGKGCREQMVFNITTMIRKKVYSPTIAPAKELGEEKSSLRFSGSEVEHIRDLLKALPNRYFAILQAWCNSGDGGPLFEKYKERVPASRWKACYASGDKCRDEMVANIREMFEKLFLEKLITQ